MFYFKNKILPIQLIVKEYNIVLMMNVFIKNQLQRKKIGYFHFIIGCCCYF
jgi:hypothetical protein